MILRSLLRRFFSRCVSFFPVFFAFFAFFEFPGAFPPSGPRGGVAPPALVTCSQALVIELPVCSGRNESPLDGLGTTRPAEDHVEPKIPINTGGPSLAVDAMLGAATRG